MSVYLRAKFQISSVTLMSFRQGRKGGWGNFNPRSPTSKRNPKNPTQIRDRRENLTTTCQNSTKCFEPSPQ